ncbi:uncharacterized protein LOC141690994 [Apium graveolens]|uniref:uncharacterized protein LOC141690994 n=1 Tax=Apium graveolens TaxID=4045 RepID=UPI003D79CCD7
MAETDLLAAIKAIQLQLDNQAVAVHQMLQQHMASIDSRLAELKSQFNGSISRIAEESTFQHSGSSSVNTEESSIPLRNMKLEVPKFDGADPHGLRADIRRDFLISRPTCLMEHFINYYIGNGPLLPTPPATLPVRRLSPQELREKREKRLCYNCDQKWNTSHKCRCKFLLMLGNDDGEGDDANFFLEFNDSVEESLVTGDISSLNALAGQGIPRSLQLMGEINRHKVQVLIDSGSTHNFVKPTVVEKLGLDVHTTSTFRVYIGNGDSLVCQFYCPNVVVLIQGHVFSMDLYVLPIEGPDIVLGIQWLQTLGKLQALVTHDEVQGLFELISLQDCAQEKKSLMNVSETIMFPSDLPSSIIYNKSVNDHCVHLRKVLKCLHTHQFFLKLSKCLFFPDNIEYLGHIVTASGVKADPQKLDSMVNWPKPSNIKQLRGFLGLTYRRFIKGYASITAPLTDLLRKDSFNWSSLAEGAFTSLKQAMLKASVLCLPDFQLEFVIETDASNVGIGAVLMEADYPIAYFSKKLGPRLQVSSTYIKELHAIAEAVHKWRQYLLGHSFIIRTDRKSIRELLQQVIQTPEQQFYVQKLLGYDFKIEYNLSKVNSAVDVLSRQPDTGTSAYTMLLTSRTIPEFLSMLRKENNSLPDLLELHKKYGHGALPPQYSITDGIIRYKGRFYVSQHSELKESLLHEFHATPIAGHAGIKWTLVQLSSLFYWPHMRRDVEQFISTCLLCQQTKYSTKAPTGLLQPLPIPSLLTKSAHFGALPTHFTATKTASVFIDIVVKHHGFPRTIISDHDPIFLSNFWKKLFELSGTTLKHKSSTSIQALDELLHDRDALLRSLKENLRTAQHRMQQKANAHRRELELEERIGSVAYRLDLPGDSKIHPVFHISLLKPFRRRDLTPALVLPKESYHKYPISSPVAICATRRVLVQGVPQEQVLVQWEDCALENATWESRNQFAKFYPDFYLADKVIPQDVENDTKPEYMDNEPNMIPMAQNNEPKAPQNNSTRPTRVRKQPTWLEEFET